MKTSCQRRKPKPTVTMPSSACPGLNFIFQMHLRYCGGKSMHNDDGAHYGWYRKPVVHYSSFQVGMFVGFGCGLEVIYRQTEKKEKIIFLIAHYWSAKRHLNFWHLHHEQ
ncbi:hypothetical protein AOLI_G00275880 [Acnodon oligacanthus]